MVQTIIIISSRGLMPKSWARHFLSPVNPYVNVGADPKNLQRDMDPIGGTMGRIQQIYNGIWIHYGNVGRIQ